MDVSILLTLAQTILQLLESPLLREVESVWGFKSQLSQLKDTMSTVSAVLLDAEEQETQHVLHNNVNHDWLQKLKIAVYEADDLFDEVATIAQQQKLIAGNKVSREVRRFFSCSNHLSFAFNMSREIKKIRKRLDDIAKDYRDFGSSDLRQPAGVEGNILRRRAESRSCVHFEDVIGRDDDKKAVIDMLLDSKAPTPNDVSFVAIVGIGGLGKTTLAQLVYNDKMIEREFPLKLWVCVSEEFDVKVLFSKLLEAITGQKHDDQLEIGQLQSQLRQNIDGKKYLLVLDDLWNENRHEWLKLRDVLIRGGLGSRILVTTRSKMVAKIIGNGPPYELKGLSRGDSWKLFEKMAFEEGHEQADIDLVEIGKEIIEKCANVPLAIRVVGSLLYGQDKSKWRSFKDTDLDIIKQDENGIIPILKLSYYHLAPPLKSCFSFCALVPKDYVIEKEILISLWMAQGFILPSYGQSVEDAGEEYFMTLLQRCFFQDIERDDHGDILSCKMHDLMHNVAQEVAGTEIVVANSNTSHFNEKKIHHLSINDGVEVKTIANHLAKMNKIRTFLQVEKHGPIDQSSMELLLENGRCLRILDLHYSYIASLPRTIGKLLHLRYLDLSGNFELETLPASVTKLYNLQTLKLRNCGSLRYLPRDLNKLVNLRHLDISECDKLAHMPPGINSLTRLCKLTMFVVGGTSHASNSKQVHFGRLEDLKALSNLKGHITIRVMNRISTSDAGKVREGGGCLMNKEHLRDLHVEWDYGEDVQRDDSYSESLLEELQPHPNIRSFNLIRYPGARLPSWASSENMALAPLSLIAICLQKCNKLQYLPLWNKLHYIKILVLYKLGNLEYIESIRSGYEACASESRTEKSLFFPSLEILRLSNLPKLKGWWRAVGEVMGANQHQQSSFPHLRNLVIWKCPMLTSIPLCPMVEVLEMHRFNEAMSMTGKEEIRTDPVSSFSHQLHPIPKMVIIDNVGYMNSLPLESFRCLSSLCIRESLLESLSTIEDLFRSCMSSSLSTLVFECCWRLKSVFGGLEHLKALQTLVLSNLPLLDMSTTAFVGGQIDKEEEDDMPWKALQSLRSLELLVLPKLMNLPKGLRYLTALQSLKLSDCDSLVALPEWVTCLTSLQSLEIVHCSGLKSLPKAICNLISLRRLEIWCCSYLTERCRKPTGEDWPKIEHIPHVFISS